MVSARERAAHQRVHLPGIFCHPKFIDDLELAFVSQKDDPFWI
jgi:hypothetical protein